MALCCPVESEMLVKVSSSNGLLSDRWRQIVSRIVGNGPRRPACYRHNGCRRLCIMTQEHRQPLYQLVLWSFTVKYPPWQASHMVTLWNTPSTRMATAIFLPSLTLMLRTDRLLMRAQRWRESLSQDICTGHGWETRCCWPHMIVVSVKQSMMIQVHF